MTTTLKRFAARIAATVCLIAASLPALAASTPWTESEGGRVRVIALPPMPDGRVPAILDIDLKPGWKTYWRDPGASGMAPEIDLSQSSNLILSGMRFPPPAHHAEGTSSLIGYDHSVQIVFNLKQTVPGAPSVLAGKLLVGICEEICIPVMADIRLELEPGQPVDGREFGAVRMAEAMLPEGPKPDFNVVSARVGNDGKSLEIDLVLPGPDRPEVFITNPRGFALAKPEIGVVEDGKATAKVAILRQPEGADFKQQTMTILVTAGRRAMETGIQPQ